MAESLREYLGKHVSGVTLRRVFYDVMTRYAPRPAFYRVAITDDYEMTVENELVGITSVVNSITVKLPAEGMSEGQRFVVSDETGEADDNPITVDGNGHLIDGLEEQTLYSRESLTVYWTGSAWSAL